MAAISAGLGREPRQHDRVGKKQEFHPGGKVSFAGRRARRVRNGSSSDSTCCQAASQIEPPRSSDPMMGEPLC